MINKTKLAGTLNISRSTLYYRDKQSEKDAEVASEILLELREHRTYGHRRVAQAIGKGKNSTLRIMKKFGIEPVRRKPKRLRKRADENTSDASIPNIMETIEISRPDKAWAEDFTYIRFHGAFVYFATVIDVFTREILGFSVKTRHKSELVIGAFSNALASGRRPEINHSDQGSEYKDKRRLDMLKSKEIRPSMSRKASPWENPHKEGFYSQFKLDYLRGATKFKTLGELAEHIGFSVRDYNENRIHSALGMPPSRFREKFLIKQSFINTQRSIQIVSHFVS